MNPTRLTLFILLLLPLILGAEQRLATLLHEEAGWEAVETQDGGLIIEEKRIPGISVRAVKVEQVLDIQPEILAQVIEDVANYNRFLTSATGLECDLLSQDSTQLIGFQYVDIPLISDRIYGFRMFRPESPQLRVDWTLLPKQAVRQYGVDVDTGVYLDLGVGTWIMVPRDDGRYAVSYRLIMDPGGWIPDSINDTFNRVSIVGIFKDAIVETQRRMKGEWNG